MFILTDGQSAGHGVPQILEIASNCAGSAFAWNIGFRWKSSPKMQL